MSVEGTLVNMSDVEQHSKLCENSELLGDKVKMIKSALKRPAGINIGLFYLFCSLFPDSKIVPCSGFAKELSGSFQFLKIIWFYQLS